MGRTVDANVAGKLDEKPQLDVKSRYRRAEKPKAARLEFRLASFTRGADVGPVGM